MKLTMVAAAALLLVGATASAEPVSRQAPGNMPDNPQTEPEQMGLQIGIGVICNTNTQAEDYVKLRARGSDITLAMNQVNAQAKDPKACGVAAIAFKRGKTVDTKVMNGKMVQIVEVNVLAGYDGQTWARVPDMRQYAVIQSKGIAI
ncbi:MAG TPA: hypothetical protein VFT69_08655 [Pseudolabrys sp.]|nr:hypothetical protein [Pseudolabrys sp.]